MKKKWMIGFAVILLFIVGYCGYQKMVEDANIIFPVDSEEVFAVTVREYNDGRYSTQRHTILSDESREALIAEMNKLNPVWDGKDAEGYITWFHKYNKQYEVILRYKPEESRLRRNIVAHIYFAEGGTIIVDCGGYTRYQDDSAYYAEFLQLLEKYENECFVSAE